MLAPLHALQQRIFVLWVMPLTLTSACPRTKGFNSCRDFMIIGKKGHFQAGQQAAPQGLLKPTAEQQHLPGSVEKIWDKAGTPPAPVLQWVKDRSIVLSLLQLLTPIIPSLRVES